METRKSKGLIAASRSDVICLGELRIFGKPPREDGDNANWNNVAINYSFSLIFFFFFVGEFMEQIALYALFMRVYL